MIGKTAEQRARQELYKSENISVVTINQVNIQELINKNPLQASHIRGQHEALLRKMYDGVFKKHFGSDTDTISFEDLCNHALGKPIRKATPPWADVNRSISVLAKNPMGVDSKGNRAEPEVYAFAVGVNCKGDPLGLMEYLAKDTDVRLPYKGVNFKVTSLEVRSELVKAMDDVAKKLGVKGGIKGFVGEAHNPAKATAEGIAEEGDPWERFAIFKKLFGSQLKVVPIQYSIPEYTVKNLTPAGQNGERSIDEYLLFLINQDGKTVTKDDVRNHLVEFNKQYYGLKHPQQATCLRQMFKDLNACGPNLEAPSERLSRSSVAAVAEIINKSTNPDDLFKMTQKAGVISHKNLQSRLNEEIIKGINLKPTNTPRGIGF